MVSDKPLASKRVAVLIESQFIPGEIKIYRERFVSYGATVELLSRLWGNPSQRFYSTIEPGVIDHLEWLEVTKDVDDVSPDDYDAVIIAANYTSLRLRWTEREDVTAANAADVERSIPAVRFLRRAMQNPNIIKGAACHGLWLLTTSPDILAGRRVLCNKVVLADIINAGAIYTPPTPNTPPEQHVVVDRDLVTNDNWHASEAFVGAIKDLILAPPIEARPSESVAAVPATPGKHRILILLSEWGYWGEELVGPLGEFDRVGYEVELCPPRGRRPNALPVSMDSDFFDTPLQRLVTSPEMAARVPEIDDPSTAQGNRLDSPISLTSWFPERPYSASSQFVRRLEGYNRDLEEAERGVERYDTVLIVGGSGALVDLA